jgi:hypothetical protein
MPTPQYENFQQMTDSVMQKFPLYDRSFARRDINDSLRMIMARRAWSGLVKYNILPVPNTYTAGLVTVTPLSSVVTGTNTVWPFNDVVDTTLLEGTITTGVIDLKPVSMSGIAPGRWLVLDGRNAGEEAVFVISVDLNSSSFRARTTLTHSAGVQVGGSSMAGRQFRINALTPFVTCTGFTSDTRMLINVPWPYAALTGYSYEVTLVYISLGQDVKELLTMVNQDRQYAFDIATPKTLLDGMDPRRNVVSMPWRLAFHETDPAGSPLYEMWPRPTSSAAFPYIYVRSFPPLAEDFDILPNGIRSDVLIKLAKAEAARWPGHKALAGGIYYDPALGKAYIEEAERDINFMKNEDDSTAIMQLVYQYKRYRVGPGGGQDWFNVDYDSYNV